MPLHPATAFPQHLVLPESGRRGAQLVREFYEQYHAGSRDDAYQPGGRQHETEKAAFFRRQLEERGLGANCLALDVGCGSGIMIKLVGLLQWVGIDLDHNALATSQAAGIPCAALDFTSSLDFRAESFDAIMMTEVLEHLPYPSIIVREVHRVLKQTPNSAYLGSVPLDYHLHRRWKVLRGKRLSGEQTHVHHFSFNELDRLLRFYFEQVEYCPLSGTARRYPRLRLSPNLFIRDIAWAAFGPRANPGRWELNRQ